MGQQRNASKTVQSPGLIVEGQNVAFFGLLAGFAVGVVNKNGDAAHVDEAKSLTMRG